jgi:hypothetical protein
MKEVDVILKFIRETEEMYISKDLKQTKKKDYCVNRIQEALPEFFNAHEDLIMVMIDTLILVSNNPELLKVSKKCFCV